MKGVFRGKFSPASNKLLSASMTCDRGSVFIQLQKLATLTPKSQSKAAGYDMTAAQAAASQAGAILDSLQMPCLPTSVPSAVTVVPISSSSVEDSSEKGGLDSDESVSEETEKTAA
jgi:hypothetical protein